MEAGSPEPNHVLNGSGSDASARGTRAPDSLVALFSGLGEAETYRLLSDLLLNLAEQNRAGLDGRSAAEQLKELNVRLNAAHKERADLVFRLQTIEADLRDREERLGLEVARIRDLETRLKDQQGRLQTVEKQRCDLEAQLVARSAELHAAERDKESLLLKAQRAASAGDESRQVQALQAENTELRSQLATLQAAVEQLRADKDAQITQLQQELHRAGKAAAAGAPAPLAPLWDRLAGARLAPGGVAPNPQVACRLADGFVDLATFAIELDEALRRLLPKYTRRVKLLNTVWQGYAAGETFQPLITRLLDPAGSAAQSGIFRMKLRVCAKWASAALIGSDATLEFIESELKNQLQKFSRERGNRAAVADFTAAGGHEEFQARMAELHSEKIAEVFQAGA